MSISYTGTLFLLFLFSCHLLTVVTAARPARAKTHTDRAKVQHDHKRHAWKSSGQFMDAQPGSHVPGLADVKRYFVRFGYLPKPGKNPTDSFDAEFESAVKLYQSRLGLPMTGRLDAATLDQITSPRCGMSDDKAAMVQLLPSQNGSVSRFTFFSGEPRWNRPEPLVLSYAISPEATIDYLPPATLSAVLRRSFARWAQVIPVRFVEATNYDKANVKVGFYAGAHGDGEPFDGVLGVLAHAFSPETGLLHLDAAERWAVDFKTEHAGVAVDLESVVTHEIGHVLGLGHSALPEAVMYASLKPRTKKVDLSVDDVEGVQALYGSNPQFRFSSMSEPDMSSVRRSSWVLAGSKFGVGTVVVIVLTLCF